MQRERESIQVCKRKCEQEEKVREVRKKSERKSVRESQREKERGLIDNLRKGMSVFRTIRPFKSILQNYHTTQNSQIVHGG